MKELPDLVLAFGNSDEYRFPARYIHGWGSMFRDCLADVGRSFVFHKDCALFERRARYGDTPIGATS
jgi:hypothetical protein